MKRKQSFRDKLSRSLCDKRDLNRKALRIKKSFDEVNELLDKVSK